MTAFLRKLLVLIVLLGGTYLILPGHAQEAGGGAPERIDEDEPAAAPETIIADADAAAETAGEAVEDLTLEEINEKQLVDRQQKELNADQLFREGKELFLDGKFDFAQKKLLDAETRYKEISLDAPRVTNKAKQVSQLLAETFEKWADQLLAEGLRLTSEEQFEEAEKRYQRAKRINPELAPAINRKLAGLKAQRERTRFAWTTHPDQVDPEKRKREVDIAEFLAKGVVLYENKRFMGAREQFEQVLVKDPYNVEAARYLRLVYEDLRSNAVRRRWATLRERMAEIEWKWIDPVPPLEVTPEALGSPRSVARDSGDMKGKLDIILPTISFQDATISTVVQFLRERSKALDPLNEGINIFLMLENPAGDEDDDDDGSGEEDFDGGDEFDEFDEFDELDAPEDGLGGEGEEDPAATIAGRTITMEFSNIPLGDAIRYICKGGDLVYRIERNAVIIADPSVPLDQMETRFFSVSPASFDPERTREGGGGFEDDDDDDGAEDAEDLAEMFAEFGIEFPEGASIRYEPRVSKLIVTNTPENLRKIEEVLNELIEAPLQVTIEAKFLEVRQEHLDELGFSWLFLGERSSSGALRQLQRSAGEVRYHVQPQAGGAIGTGLLSDATRSLAQSSNALLGIDLILDNIELSTLLYWFNRKDGSDLLSAPRVTTVSGQTAVIRMVTEMRFPDSFTQPEFTTSTAGVTSFTPPVPEFGEAREIGVILTVTPTIDHQDKYTIDLDLSPEVLEHTGFDRSYNTSAVVEGIPVELRFDTPLIERRSLETRVNVWDGETVVLGGTIRDSIDKIDDKMPILGDLPLIGRLFSSKGEFSSKKNLLIFVSARIVNPAGLPIRRQQVRGLPDFRR